MDPETIEKVLKGAESVAHSPCPACLAEGKPQCGNEWCPYSYIKSEEQAIKDICAEVDSWPQWVKDNAMSILFPNDDKDE
jgi:hypothetical protein